MGWKDGTPLDQSSAAPAQSQQDAPPQQSQQPAPSQSGWRSGQPLNQPSAPAAPTASASTASSPSDDLGTTALWNKPADTSWSDYMLAHLAKALPSGAFDPHVNANEGVLLGSGLSGGLSGFIPGMRERTAQAEQETPLGNRIAIQGAGYMLGPGKLGIASKLGEGVAPYLGNWAGGVLGSAGEGALSSGVGAAGAGGSASDVAKAAGVGLLAGGAGGVPGGVVGRGGALAAPVSEDALRAAASQKYAPLDEMVFHGPSQVKPALDAVTSTMTDAEKDLAKSTMAKVDKLGDLNLATGSDIQSYQKLFGGLAKTGSDVDRQYAPQFKNALETVMQADPYGRNLTPRQGMSLMPAGTLGGTGFAPGAAAAARDAGNVPFRRANDVARLDDWIAKSQVAGGPDVGGQASSYLRTQQGQRYAPPGSVGYNAINALAKTNAGPDLSAAPGAWDIRHGVHPLVSALATGAITGAGGQIASGHYDPATLATEAAAGAALGYGLHKGVPWAQKTFVQLPAQQRAIEAARSALSTGQQQVPVLPPAPLRDMIRNLIYGQGASGAY